MSRQMTMDMATALSQTHQVPVVLAEFEFDSGTIGMWTGFGTLQWGDKTFFGGGNLCGVSEIKESQDLIAQNVIFNLNGVASSNISLALTENLQRRPCSVWLGLVAVNVSLNLEGSGGDETPILLEGGSGEEEQYLLLESQLIADPLPVFAGLMDVISGIVDIPASSIQLTAESILILLRRSNESRYTDEEQKSRYPGDRFFENIAQLQDKEITW